MILNIYSQTTPVKPAKKKKTAFSGRKKVFVLPENPTANIASKINIDDHTAELVNRMAKKFYSNPENVKKFEEWHLKTYGCLPQ